MRICIMLYLQRDAHVVIIRFMTTDNAGPVTEVPAVTEVSGPAAPYRLTLSMPEKYRPLLKTAAEQAHLLQVIDEPTVHAVMNLFITLGLTYLRDEGRKKQGYR
jgi:hypothetical protein